MKKIVNVTTESGKVVATLIDVVEEIVVEEVKEVKKKKAKKKEDK